MYIFSKFFNLFFRATILYRRSPYSPYSPYSPAGVSRVRVCVLRVGAFACEARVRVGAEGGWRLRQAVRLPRCARVQGVARFGGRVQGVARFGGRLPRCARLPRPTTRKSKKPVKRPHKAQKQFPSIKYTKKRPPPVLRAFKGVKRANPRFLPIPFYGVAKKSEYKPQEKRHSNLLSRFGGRIPAVARYFLFAGIFPRSHVAPVLRAFKGV